MELRAWTDSTIPELGDAPGRAAPIREVTILGYDGRDNAIAVAAGKTVRIDVRYLYVRSPESKKTPAVSAKPSPRRPPSIAVDSAYVRIKSSRADLPSVIYKRPRDLF
jgi:hypothetical protein